MIIATACNKHNMEKTVTTLHAVLTDYTEEDSNLMSKYTL